MLLQESVAGFSFFLVLFLAEKDLWKGTEEVLRAAFLEQFSPATDSRAVVSVACIRVDQEAVERLVPLPLGVRWPCPA